MKKETDYGRQCSLLMAWLLAAFTFITVEGGADDWPLYSAHNRAPEPEGRALVDDLGRIRKVFETTELHAGVGKALYNKQRRLGEEMGIDVLPGGTSSPIVAEGTVFISFYRPSGDARLAGEATTFRTLGSREDWDPAIWCIAADDCLLAIDTETGKKRWLAAHEGKGLNRVTIKRNDWGPAPCYHDGKVFFLGTTARVYAHDARTGDLLWEAETPAHEELAAAKREALEKREWGPRHGLHTGSVVAGGILVVPTAAGGGLTGIDLASGKALWTISDRKDEIQSELGTPRIWTRDGREYVLAINRRGTMSLIDPRCGAVIWRHPSGGSNHGTVPLEGDIVILNVEDKPEDIAKGATIWGAYRLSLEGPEGLIASGVYGPGALADSPFREPES